MYSVIGFRKLFLAIALLSLGAGWLFSYLLELETLLERSRVIWQVGAGIASIAILLGRWERAIRFLWTRTTFFFGPCPIGIWEGTIESNFSRQEWIRSMVQKGEAVEALDNVMDEIPLKRVKCRLAISAHLYGMEAIMTMPENGDRHSYTLSMSAKRLENGGLQLAYVYQQELDTPTALDEANHVGAALLELDAGGTVLKGPYWTRRRWQHALNTAGRLTLERFNG